MGETLENSFIYFLPFWTPSFLHWEDHPSYQGFETKFLEAEPRSWGSAVRSIIEEWRGLGGPGESIRSWRIRGDTPG